MNNLKLYLKSIFGIIFLIILIIYSIKHGELIRNAGIGKIAFITFLTVINILINSLITFNSSALFSGKLTHYDTLKLSVYSAISNTIGGIPIGLAYKLYIFHKKANLSKKEIAISLVYFTLLNISSLLLISGAFTHNLILILPLALSYLAVLPGLNKKLANNINLDIVIHTKNILLSLLTCTLMICSYLVASSPSGAFSIQAENIGFISTGLAVNFAINAQSIGGAQELTMGIASWLFEHELTLGIESALLIRACSFAAATLLLIIVILIGQKRKYKSITTA